jgi:uncharacterized LabA/DUF88 family protein
VDGGFFHRRYNGIFRRIGELPHDAATVARNLYTMLFKHLDTGDTLYRIFYYDCPPLDKKVHNPVDGRCIDYSRSIQAKFRLDFFQEMRRRRKVALRLGHIGGVQEWQIKGPVVKDLLQKKKTVDDLTPDDVYYAIEQKGVDMRIGVDIASLAYKNLVGRIVLIAGDSDFVPAAKLARREGIDFILDPMWMPIHPTLFEHIDGLKSTCPRPEIHKRQKKDQGEPCADLDPSSK